LKRIHRSDYSSHILLDVTPENAGWRYISFKVVRLEKGRKFEADTAGNEMVIVPLVGRGRLSFGGITHDLVRGDLFRELADIAYLPPRTSYVLEAIEPLEIAIGGAPAEGRLCARMIRREEMTTAVRGRANVARSVSALLDSDELAERLTVYEIQTPSGNWSSFPPHRHDSRDNSSYHEETYYYRLRPSDGFAIQRIYTRDTDLDVALPVHDGDVVLIHEGYHPVVKAPGTNAYYLNFLAGDVRKISAVNDPHYDWIRENWSGNPIHIPIKGDITRSGRVRDI
jgi:5-deoxy-glucuronate isomerase